VLEHFTLVDPRTANDQHQRAVVARRTPDLVEPRVQFFGRQVTRFAHHPLFLT
jgi:hypothetical protein